MKKKLTIIGFSAIAISLFVAVLLLTGAAGGGNTSAPAVRVIALEKQNLEQSISLSGTVYSAQSTEVHSTLHFPVQSVNVRVGDKVNEGDLLALLDMSLMEMEVRQLQASLSAAQAAANQNLVMNRNALEALQRNIATGDDPAIMEARLGISNARLAVHAAEIEMRAVGANVANARRDLREYRRYYRNYDDEFDTQFRHLRSVVLQAETAHDIARSKLQIAIENLAKSEEIYETVRVLSADALSIHEDMVRAAQIATNFSDMQIAVGALQDELEKAEIRAPVSGTVTAVIAEEGALGTGLLFVIQDTDNLVVKTNIKEFDIASVSLGNQVNIRSDATGGRVFTGTLSRIAPTSTVMAYGSNQHSSYAEFESEVTVPSGSGLKIGMHTRLSIVRQQRDNVFALPAQALRTNESGESIIYIAAPGEDGRYFAQAVAVTTGMETGQLIEVWAESLDTDTLVIENAVGLQPGMLISPQIHR